MNEPWQGYVGSCVGTHTTIMSSAWIPKLRCCNPTWQDHVALREPIALGVWRCSGTFITFVATMMTRSDHFLHDFFMLQFQARFFA